MNIRVKKVTSSVLILIASTIICYATSRDTRRIAKLMNKSFKAEHKKYAFSKRIIIANLNFADSLIWLKNDDTVYVVYEEYIDVGRLIINVASAQVDSHYQVFNHATTLKAIDYTPRYELPRIKSWFFEDDSLKMKSICTGSHCPVITAFRVIKGIKPRVKCMIE